MPETHLSHDEFFTKLGELFAHRKGSDHGSIFLSQKRLTHGQDDAPVPTKEAPLADIQDDPVTAASSPSPSRTFPVLVRASNGKAGEDREAGKRVKLSTVVDSDALDAFYVRYAEICKAGMGALKPRDRSKRKTKGKKKKTAAGGGA